MVEVVSPSTQTTDDRHKRSEYAVLGIQEYWIVDPVGEIVTFLMKLQPNRLQQYFLKEFQHPLENHEVLSTEYY